MAGDCATDERGEMMMGIRNGLTDLTRAIIDQWEVSLDQALDMSLDVELMFFALRMGQTAKLTFGKNKPRKALFLTRSSSRRYDFEICNVE